MNSLGNRINIIRKNAELTQTQFAERLGVSPSYVSKLEADKENASITLLKLICAEFTITEEWLTNGVGKMNDEYSDYNKVNSTIATSDAIVNLVGLLDTVSNVKYSHYSYSLNALTNLLRGDGMSGELLVMYLESIEEILSNTERAVWVYKRILVERSLSNDNVMETVNILKDHINAIQTSMAQIIEVFLLEGLNRNNLNKELVDIIHAELNSEIKLKDHSKRIES